MSAVQLFPHYFCSYNRLNEWYESHSHEYQGFNKLEPSAKKLRREASPCTRAACLAHDHRTDRPPTDLPNAQPTDRPTTTTTTDRPTDDGDDKRRQMTTGDDKRRQTTTNDKRQTTTKRQTTRRHLLYS